MNGAILIVVTSPTTPIACANNKLPDAAGAPASTRKALQQRTSLLSVHKTLHVREHKLLLRKWLYPNIANLDANAARLLPQSRWYVVIRG